MHSIQAGDLLIAEPFMDDLPFRRTVVLIVSHDDAEGTVGFVLNKSLNLPVSSVLKRMGEFAAPVGFGGPMDTDTVHYLHTKADLIQQSIPVTQGIYWGGNFEQVQFCAQHELLTETEIRFVIGYAGWAAGQLAEELENKYWIQTQAYPNYIFNTPEDTLWKRCLEDMGGTYSVLAQMPMPFMN